MNNWRSIGELATRLVQQLKRKEEQTSPSRYSERDILEILRANRDLRKKPAELDEPRQ
jgi:hypothetical protein